MSADGSVTMVWGEGEHKFRLAIGEFRQLQERLNGRRVAMGQPVIGPQTLLDLLRSNNAWPDDVRDILRLGLIGAGMAPPDAHRQMVTNFDARPLMEGMTPALVVLAAALVGVPDDPATDSKKKTETTSQSGSGGSTASAPPSASRQRKSTRAPSGNSATA